LNLNFSHLVFGAIYENFNIFCWFQEENLKTNQKKKMTVSQTACTSSSSSSSSSETQRDTKIAAKARKQKKLQFNYK
jgi:hypothetical protein